MISGSCSQSVRSAAAGSCHGTAAARGDAIRHGVGAAVLGPVPDFDDETVYRDRVSCHFGRGIVHRSIALADLASVSLVRNSWLAGWGVRLTPTGWMWNVSGLDAVELVFVDGRRFRIGK